MRIDEEKLGEAVAAFTGVYDEPKASTADAVWAVLKSYFGEDMAREVVVHGPDEVMETTVEEIYDLQCYGWDEDAEAFVRLMVPLLYRAVSLVEQSQE